MSFDQEINNTYKSLPYSNNFRTLKTVNFTMPQATSKITIPINNGLTSSTSISSMNTQQQQQQNNNLTTNTSTTTTKTNTATNQTTTINTEEFAKLDALLEDLLAEVEQPILLNKDGIISSTNWNDTNSLSKKRINSYNDGLNMNNNNNNKENYRMHSSRHLNGVDDLERSVDWLNEQKERLKSRKEQISNSYSSKHNNEIVDDPYNYRKVNSKLDYYVTNSNGNQYQSNSLQKNLTKNGFSYTANNPASTASFVKLNSNGYHNGENNNNNNNNMFDLDSNDPSPTVTLNGEHYNSNHYINNNNNINNKPPASPNLNHSRQMYTQSAEPPTNGTLPFRSLSTNPTLLRNITEADDMMMMIEPEFDRYSQRSYRSTSTVQRSKYHTVSNDFVECTRPSAPTPVPTPLQITSSSSNGTTKTAAVVAAAAAPNYPNKRALSAPPTEMGKVVLQRMELKSPLTVRQGSVIPFEQQQQQQLIQRVQTPVNGSRNGQKYNNNSVVQQQPTSSINCPPTRNVFLNRAYSEAPRVLGYATNGYETDSGIAGGRTFTNGQHSYRNQNVYNNANSTNGQQQQQFLVVDNVDSQEHLMNNNSSTGYALNGGSYRSIGAGSNNINNNGYRTIQTPSRQQQQYTQNNGYETDSGLVKLRQVLDNNRRTSSRNNIPIQHQQLVPVVGTNGTNGYYYPTNRSMTPSFSYAYNQHQSIPTHYNSTNLNEPPITHTQQYIVTTYPNDIETIDFIDNPTELVQSPVPQFQYTNGTTTNNNNGVIEKISGYIAHDGRPVLINDTPNHQNNNGLIPQSQSLIIQHQIGPYNNNNNNNNKNETNNDINGNSRDTPSRLTQISNNNNNNIGSSNGQLNQQIVSKQDSRRSSANSLLAAESSEILRNHPKSVKTTQNFWYKPKISRDEAINLLKDKPPGTFLIRDSNNFPGAYGLALKVDKPPPNVQIKPGVDPLNELVRHFLIEPTSKGVRIKGCYNEPIFGSLAALVYQHSLTPLALPTKLILPVKDLVVTANNNTNNNNEQSNKTTNGGGQSTVTTTPKQVNNQQQQLQQQQQVQDARHLLEKGAACNVYYLSSVTLDNKNGIDAISTALNGNKSFQAKDSSQLLLIQFKVTAQGITLTDLNRKKFMRQHFPTNTVTYCAIEEKQIWPNKFEKIAKPRIFGLITKPQINTGPNEVHLFVELDPDQPAIAIVDFINRYLIPSKVETKN